MTFHLFTSRLRALVRWNPLCLALAMGLCAQTGALAAPANPYAADLFPLSHRVWKTEHGLPTNTIRGIQSTPDGYLWIGTEEGLVRFDGLHFRFYDKGNEPAFHGNMMGDLARTPDGTLWVCTDDSGLIRRVGNRFENVQGTLDLPSARINTLHVDPRGQLWLGSTGGGIFQWVDGRFTPLRGFPANRNAMRMASTPDGALWVGTFQKEVLRWKDGVATPIPALAGRPMMQLATDGTGTLWLCFEDGSLWAHHSADPPERMREIKDPRLGQVATMAPGPDGRLYLGTTANGVFSWNGRSFQPMAAVDALPKAISALSFDASGNLWVGTWGEGLHLIQRGSIAALTPRQGLSCDTMLAVCEDRASVIWAGGFDGRVNRIEHGRLTVHRLPAPTAQWVTALAPRQAGGVWVGTQGNGLFALDEAGRPIPLPRARRGGAPNSIDALVEDVGGALWMGGAEGVTRWAPQVSPECQPVVRGAGPVDHLLLLPDGRILFGASSGIGVIAGTSVTYPWNTKGSNSQRSTGIISAQDGFFTGFENSGLAHLGGSGIARWQAKNGLWNDNVCPAAVDGYGRLWLGSNRGIFYIQTTALKGGKLLTSVVFGRDDGMPAEECNSSFSNSTLRARDGLIWFCTTGGLAILDPSRVPNMIVPPQTFIERVLSDGKEVGLGAPIRLEKGKGRLSVQYVAPSLNSGRRVTYRHRLRGFEEEWMEAGARREAFYTNLPPGQYTFEVQATLLGHEDQISQASIDVLVPPAFYQTWWFTLFCLGGAGAIVWRFYQHRVRELGLRNELLAERNRIGMELHDHLSQLMTGQLLQLEAARLAIEEADGGQEGLSHIDRASGLARRGIEETRKTIWGLRSSMAEKESLAEKLMRAIQPLREGTSVKVSYEQKGLAFPLPSKVVHELFRVGQEAMTNAIRHGGAKRIDLALAFEAKGVRLTIQDDGQGFEVDQVDSGPFHGLGLTGMSQRMAGLGGDIQIQSVPGVGTTVVGYVPRRRSRW